MVPSEDRRLAGRMDDDDDPHRYGRSRLRLGDGVDDRTGVAHGCNQSEHGGQTEPGGRNL